MNMHSCMRNDHFVCQYFSCACSTIVTGSISHPWFSLYARSTTWIILIRFSDPGIIGASVSFGLLIQQSTQTPVLPPFLEKDSESSRNASHRSTPTCSSGAQHSRMWARSRCRRWPGRWRISRCQTLLLRKKSSGEGEW